MEIYEPIKRESPKVTEKYQSAWGDIPTILLDIIERFNLRTNLCLEFGVEYGYSTSALANYFNKVIGVDTFIGDKHSTHKKNHLDETKECLKNFKNITLIQNDYKDFIFENDGPTTIYDLIHIDIVHTYNETYECADWSIKHSPIVILHDTESHESVKKVCIDLSKKHNIKFFNYPHSYGLGILYNEKFYNEIYIKK